MDNTDDRSLDEILRVGDGDVVQAPKGYSLVTAAKTADFAIWGVAAAALAAKTLASSRPWREITAAGGTAEEFVVTAGFDERGGGLHPSAETRLIG
jgi:hypothetical protein